MGWLERFRRAPAENAMATALAAAQKGDYAAALSIWEPLARTGNARAQNNIAACFSGGHGVAPDAGIAAKWLKLSAAAGDAVGQRNLATLHFRGEGVPQDDAEAMRLYRLAADQGDAAAQDMLSWMLAEQGDYEQARLHAERAAAQGVAASMTRLGNLHHDALGVERDPVAALGWWRKAAGLGDADAQAMLGAAHLTGAGVAPDPMTALAWLLRARDGGSKLAAKFIPAATTQLSQAERDEAARRAARLETGGAP
ncbi:tetratricopeptide repeat protein [Aquamicrobium sp. LC103]|uniref:tetratricopeptide repeat protein n=1 Tax=Aquamicrobium sp. LC103 TaxID=1120658 RepID=UPI0010C95827|nr:tetratricopeptide repeat protein [Aquamicrobium sp. LC103]TKT69108.1 sel1 repeat family protein [Aquamicrobium sp. LC103]